MSTHATMKEQLANEFDIPLPVEVQGTAHDGTAFNVTVSTLSLSSARLEETCDVLRKEIDELAQAYETLVQSGERPAPVESWCVKHKNTILVTGIESQKTARDMVRQASVKMADNIGYPEMANVIRKECSVELERTFPASAYLRRLQHKINARVNQLDQTDQLLTALKERRAA